MSLVLNGTSQYLKLGSALVSGSPLFMTAWVKPTALSGDQIITSVSQASASNNKSLFFTSGTTIVAQDASGTGAQATIAAAGSNGSWQFFAGLLLNSTSRTVWSGSTSGTNATSKTPTSLALSFIGAIEVSGTGVSFFKGKIAAVGFWNTDQSANITQLRAGYTPDNFQSGLVAYLLLNGDATDAKGNSWSNIGTATFDTADNPTLIYPHRGLLMRRRRSAA